MGQIQVCDGQQADKGHLLLSKQGLLQEPGRRGPLRFCACIPAQSPVVQECCVSSRSQTKSEKIWLDDDNFATEWSNFGSEYEFGGWKQNSLVLARARLFSPHMQIKFADFYQTDRKIGEGSYGNVFEAIARPVNPKTGRPEAFETPDPAKAFAPPPAAGTNGAVQQTERRVAVKAFSMETPKVDEDPERSEADIVKDRERAQRELAGRRASFEAERSILAKLEHPHIVKMYECFEEKSTLFIVLELCRGGELYEKIAAKARQSGGGGLDEPAARNIFRQMLHACSYLHANNIVHRDIKTENFLLLGEPGTAEADTIKLCDFGTAAYLSEQKPRSMERIGTLSYTAPEIYGNRGANCIADAWSLGVVLYVLLVGASPFRTSGNESREETMRRILNGDFEQRRPAWQKLSAEAKDLVQRFLVVEEPTRLTSKEALRHTWVEPSAGGRLSLSLRLTGSSPRSRTSVPASPRGTGGGDLRGYAHHMPLVISLLIRFTRLDAMQQLVLTICAQTMSENELISRRTSVPWYDLFFALDSNEDGQLDFEELVEGLKHLLGPNNAVSDERLLSLVRALDLDSSGRIEWVEWIAVALLAIGGFAEEPEPLSTAFRLLDRPSGDGTIGAADLLAVINSDANSMCLVSGAGREQAIRILNRWTPGANGKKKPNPNGLSPPPTLRLEDIRRVLESIVTQDVPPAMAFPVQEETTGSSMSNDWRAQFRCPTANSGRGAWYPDGKEEVQVLVNQQRVVPRMGASPQNSRDPSPIGEQWRKPGRI
mmetsp:Transcript_44101/g.78071  ORF Transcript_44101/g.78071 Transcript_44101/m.78071 type:complete len:771 (-) Transcript_44101:301-2613(-)